MGTYLIPGAKSGAEAAAHVEWAPDRVWTVVDGGVRVDDPNLSDAELAELYAGFSPSGVDDLEFRPRTPARWRTHFAHLRDFRDGIRAGTLTPTNAMRDHAIADVIDLLAHVLPRLDDE